MHGKDLPFDTVCMPNHYRGAECRKLPCALSAGRRKELIHLWKTNRLFRYDLSIILAQDMNSSVILIASGGGGDRRCWKTCVAHGERLAAGILRSAPRVQGPLSHLLALICRHRPLLQAHHWAAEWIWAGSSDHPSGRLHVPFTPSRTSTPTVSPARVSSEVGCCLCCLLHNGIKKSETSKHQKQQQQTCLPGKIERLTSAHCD